ncbi:MAG: hypothetical protein KatS3mg090_0759 [Patescibacteria group bacterium]|nr:MAG: hypothetical protein KatS3mg090_0759 [Patescibacteria group bacterium]
MSIDSIIAIDHLYTGSIRSLFGNSSFFYVLFAIFTNPYFILLFFYITALFLFSSQNIIKKIIFFFLIGGCVFFVSDYLLKYIFKISRPDLNQFCPSNYSFPSSHSVIAFTYAVFLSFINRHFTLLLLFIAGLIGTSRIYLGCHYLSDVVVGGVIGSLFGYLFFLMFKKYIA